MEYQEFMELVPEETKIFVDSLLPYLSYYSDRELEYKEIISSNDTNKKLFLSLYVLSENPIYHNLLVQLDFDRSLYKINSKKIEEKNIIRQEVFHCMDDILTDNDPTVFRNLTPIDIVLVFLRKYQLDKTVSDRIFKYIFHDKIRADNLYNQLTKYSSQIKQNRIIQIENSIYNHVPNHIISYFETASKIYKVLFLSLNKDSEIYHKNANDIVSLSMLLSLFYYQDVSLFPENSLTEKQIIESLFKLRKITAPSIMNKLSIQFNLSAIQSTPKDIFVIQDYLIRYYQDLVNQKNDESNIMVSEIVEKLFDHNYTNSFAIDKILTSFGFPIQYFSNLHEQVETEIKNQKQQLDMDFIHSFYKNLSHDTRVFIEFTAKTYQLLLEKMKTNTHNKELLSGEDDADTLALYIANCYFHGDVDRFFQMYGVTLQKVLELLNISISKEEIEKVQLNQKILVERFHRFVYEGINQSKTNITINDIVMNLCNRDFNQSMIMENVFESITEKMNLDIDFYHQLKEVFIQKELSRKEKVQQKLFQDMPRETINYLENVSKVHQALLCCKDININQKDIKVYSLLLGILYLQEDNISLFFRSLEFDSSKIYSYLSNKIKTYPLHFNQYEIDVDLLSNQYGMYIFGGKNQNKSRKELTIKAIASNIFNQELNNSISIAKFLNKFHHSYEEFEDFDSLYEKWQNTKMVRNIKRRNGNSSK